MTPRPTPLSLPEELAVHAPSSAIESAAQPQPASARVPRFRISGVHSEPPRRYRAASESDASAAEAGRLHFLSAELDSPLLTSLSQPASGRRAHCSQQIRQLPGGFISYEEDPGDHVGGPHAAVPLPDIQRRRRHSYDGGLPQHPVSDRASASALLHLRMHAPVASDALSAISPDDDARLAVLRLRKASEGTMPRGRELARRLHFRKPELFARQLEGRSEEGDGSQTSADGVPPSTAIRSARSSHAARQPAQKAAVHASPDFVRAAVGDSVRSYLEGATSRIALRVSTAQDLGAVNPLFR